jgi:hypothetical protein
MIEHKSSFLDQVGSPEWAYCREERDWLKKQTDCKILGFHGGEYEECHHLGCWRSVTFVRTDVSEGRIASVIGVARIIELESSFVVCFSC